MKLGVMQPYFLPYIGYWQLIKEVDTFVLFDDIQYMRRAWVNRNRILKHGGGWQYITIPVRKHQRNELIKNIYANSEYDWKNQMLRQLEHYCFMSKHYTLFYSETLEMLNNVFAKIKSENITKINEVIIREVCGYLDINTEILVSSEHNFNYSDVHDAGEWALRIAEQLHADEYLNPVGGKNLFDGEKFKASGMCLKYFQSNEIIYEQGQDFEPWLSIVDVLMFNGRMGTQSLLEKYSIVSDDE